MVLPCLTSTADTASISEMIAERLAALQTKSSQELESKMCFF